MPRFTTRRANPFLRLIRSEVEAFVDKKYGGIHLKQKKVQKELDQIDRDLRLLKRHMAHLEKRRAGLLATLESCTPTQPTSGEGTA
jgi:hypothetical protein